MWETRTNAFLPRDGPQNIVVVEVPEGIQHLPQTHVFVAFHHGEGTEHLYGRVLAVVFLAVLWDMSGISTTVLKIHKYVVYRTTLDMVPAFSY